MDCCLSAHSKMAASNATFQDGGTQPFVSPQVGPKPHFENHQYRSTFSTHSTHNNLFFWVFFSPKAELKNRHDVLIWSSLPSFINPFVMGEECVSLFPEGTVYANSLIAISESNSWRWTVFQDDATLGKKSPLFTKWVNELYSTVLYHYSTYAV